MGPLDIAVAGCGPGGLTAALLLKRDGHRVTLFERFETPLPIGSGLMVQPTGLAVLEQLGLADVVLQSGARIDRLIGKAGTGGRVVLDVRYAALGHRPAFGIGIHRASLFALLHDAVIAAGIPIATGRTVAGAILDGATRHLRFADGNTAGPFDLVVDALGTRTPLAPPTGRSLAYGALWASLDWPDGASFDNAALEQRYRRASTMVGVLPIGNGSNNAGRPQVAFFWSLRADRLDEWRAAGLDAWKAEVLPLWPACAPLLDQIVSPDQLTFAHYAHRTLRNPAEPALIHIGDAWHSASPQLGQGANMALLDAWALARGLRESASVAAGLERAIARRRRHVHLYQRLTALFTPVYQSDSLTLPFVRDRLVGPLSKLWPATWIQAAMVSGLIGNPLRPLGLDAPRPSRGNEPMWNAA
ncbi:MULTISPECIES: NAD(P)/FAD-dependent oxidoreductase [unclassified Sphingomonas]|uniref:FAD-dependent oxidoreductase n=1 Tax=unclassified Sphingomonas TaxID=196159 RepID=UPI000926B81A|nr:MULTISPECIES: NAD(P)/FAD-dependent oxidoreductase [unclassified Sphingomonas]MBN8847447.1 FAD-dependent monooxygenase [Sphingomonas sp.]OJV32640.1 MAG: glutamate synthase [Sphingomonas sp. 67-36]